MRRAFSMKKIVALALAALFYLSILPPVGAVNWTFTDNVTVNGTLTVVGAPTFTDNTINGADLVDSTVTSAKILDNAIVNADINSAANIAGSKLLDNSVTSAKLVDNTVAISKLATTGTADNTGFLRGDGAWATSVSTTGLSICNLSKSATQSITGGAETYIIWETEDSDVLLAHNPAVDNTIITIPTGYTYANFYVTTLWNGTATAGANRQALLTKNTTTIAANITTPYTSASATNMLVSGWIPVSAGDNVAVKALSTDNAVLNANYGYFRAEFK